MCPSELPLPSVLQLFGLGVCGGLGSFSIQEGLFEHSNENRGCGAVDNDLPVCGIDVAKLPGLVIDPLIKNLAVVDDDVEAIGVFFLEHRFLGNNDRTEFVSLLLEGLVVAIVASLQIGSNVVNLVKHGADDIAVFFSRRGDFVMPVFQGDPVTIGSLRTFFGSDDLALQYLGLALERPLAPLVAFKGLLEALILGLYSLGFHAVRRGFNFCTVSVIRRGDLVFVRGLGLVLCGGFHGLGLDALVVIVIRFGGLLLGLDVVPDLLVGLVVGFAG